MTARIDPGLLATIPADAPEICPYRGEPDRGLVDVTLETIGDREAVAAARAYLDSLRPQAPQPYVDGAEAEDAE